MSFTFQEQELHPVGLNCQQQGASPTACLFPSVHSPSPVFGRDSLYSFHPCLPILLQPLVAVDPRHGRAMHLLEKKSASEQQRDSLDAVPVVPSRGRKSYWLWSMVIWIKWIMLSAATCVQGKLDDEQAATSK